MIKRPLAIVTADPEVEKAAREAAAQAGEAVGPVRIYQDRITFEQVASRLDGIAILDPEIFAPDGVHEWTLGFLRKSKSLVFLFTRGSQNDADALARFVGAQGAVAVPFEPRELADRLISPFGAERPRRLVEDVEETADLAPNLDELLKGKPGGPRDDFVQKITDPETGLFNAAFWDHRFDEEYKRASRFRFPLGFVAFAFDGEADEVTLLDIAGVILTDTRDVDIVGRLDRNTFVALLPHTGPGGTEHFARRVVAGLNQRDLTDLLGEPLEWTWCQAVGPDTAIGGADAFLKKVLGGLSQFA